MTLGILVGKKRRKKMIKMAISNKIIRNILGDKVSKSKTKYYMTDDYKCPSCKKVIPFPRTWEDHKCHNCGYRMDEDALIPNTGRRRKEED